MAKSGIMHDYDLLANNEASAQGNKCVVCDAHPVVYQWSDYNGEAMCTQCGAPYQLANGSEEQRAEGKYPYMNLADPFPAIAKEYWNHAHSFVHYGMSFSRSDGVAPFNAWLESTHPELCTKEGA